MVETVSNCAVRFLKKAEVRMLEIVRAIGREVLDVVRCYTGAAMAFEMGVVQQQDGFSPQMCHLFHHDLVWPGFGGMEVLEVAICKACTSSSC
jgi:hypothetical protein